MAVKVEVDEAKELAVAVIIWGAGDGPNVAAKGIGVGRVRAALMYEIVRTPLGMSVTEASGQNIPVYVVPEVLKAHSTLNFAASFRITGVNCGPP